MTLYSHNDNILSRLTYFDIAICGTEVPGFTGGSGEKGLRPGGEIDQIEQQGKLALHARET